MNRADLTAGIHVPTLLAADARARRYAENNCMLVQLPGDLVADVYYRVGVDNGRLYIEEVTS